MTRDDAIAFISRVLGELRQGKGNPDSPRVAPQLPPLLSPVVGRRRTKVATQSLTLNGGLQSVIPPRQGRRTVIFSCELGSAVSLWPDATLASIAHGIPIVSQVGWLRFTEADGPELAQSGWWAWPSFGSFPLGVVEEYYV